MNRALSARALITLLAAALAAGCAGGPGAPSRAAPFHDALIVPNKRIGPALLGMTPEQMIAWLGRPDEAIGSGDSAWRYSRDGLQVAFDTGRAYIISVTGPGYATADGLRVGSTANQVAARWGKPTQSRESTRCVDHKCETTAIDTLHQCYANGMQADIDARSNSVIELQVRTGRCQSP
jgi:hypothetical protein